MPFGFLADPARFFGAVPDADDPDLPAVTGIGPQRLAEPARIVRDEAVGGGENVRSRAIILFETDDLRAGEVMLEAEDVGDLGAAPAVDRLIVVADDAKVAARLGEQLQPFVLGLVRVLIFVDEDVAEAVAISVEDVRLGPEDHQHMQQQVAEIAGVQRLQPLLILRVEFGAAAGGEGFGLAGIDLLRGPAAILPPVDERGELARRPALLVEIRSGDELLQDPELVVGVEDREIGLEPDELGMASEHSRGDRMEGAEPRHALDRSAGYLRHALLHLARGLVGEGDRQDLARPGLAGRDQVGESRRERCGLSGPGACEDENRPFGRQDSFALRRVQAPQIGRFGQGDRRFRHLAELGGGERNGNRSEPALCESRRFLRFCPISPLSTAQKPNFSLLRLG